MSHDSGTIQGSRVAADLHWISGRVFDVLGAWAGEADDPAVAVAMATTSRHLSWHVADLHELLPATEPDAGPDDGEEPAPLFPAVADALDSIRKISGTIERLGVAERVLVTRLAVECIAIHRDSRREGERDPVVGIIDAMLGDLRRDRDEGEFLLARLVTDAVALQRVSESVLEAERRLVEVGGLRPARAA